MNDRSTRNPIDVLADEFVQRYRQGERPTIEQFAQQHPEFADDIRNLFPMLVNIEQLKRPAATADGTRVALPAASIEQLGDFRIIREIGRGGMGVVFEAEQQSLGRRVALKVLGDNVAGSPNRVQRFRREAEAAARLHHTNIVPVYGVGQEHDLHFYAMQFIDGVGLDVVLRVLCGPSPRADTLAGNLDDTGTHPDSPSVAAAINAANAAPRRILLAG